MNLQIAPLTESAPQNQPLEIVERKGLGHPDTICDALAEAFSKRLCRYYHEQFGLVLHHNVDKGLLFGGRSQPAFRGGHVLEPMEVYLVGRATTSFEGKRVPVEELAREETSHWFRRHFHALDPDRHLKIHFLLREGSKELTELYLRRAKIGVALANDTSCGVGYAPLDDLERVVLGVEQHLNRTELHREYPAIGQDIKIMGVRTEQGIQLTVACALVGRHLRDLDAYRRHTRHLAEWTLRFARQQTRLPVEATINAADDLERDSIYLTVTGTSGESGDDGQVGRGNRANGLITPHRPMNMEAVAGKNPVTHVGKIYNILAKRLAARLVGNIAEVEEAYCYLVSQIGQPVNEPRQVEIRVRLAKGGRLSPIRRHISEVTEMTMEEANDLWQQVVKAQVDPVY